MNKTIIVFYLLIAAFLVSCRKGDSENVSHFVDSFKKIDISEGIEKKEEHLLSDIASECELVVLETNSESQLGRPGPIEFINNKNC